MITTVWSIVQVYRNLFSWFISYITDTTFASLMTVISNLTYFFIFYHHHHHLYQNQFSIYGMIEIWFFSFLSVLSSQNFDKFLLRVLLDPNKTVLTSLVITFTYFLLNGQCVILKKQYIFVYSIFAYLCIKYIFVSFLCIWFFWIFVICLHFLSKDSICA